jgi:hypothetical protein
LYFNIRAADLGVQPADDVEIQDLTPSDWELRRQAQSTLWGRILYFNIRTADLGVQPTDDVEIQDLTPR